MIHQYKIPLILGAISIILIVISLTLLVKSIQTTTPIEFSETKETAATASATIHVDIEGAVQQPGVYALSVDSRVSDAVTRAGGLTDEADREKIAKTINLAQILHDGAKLYFPKISDSPGSDIVRHEDQGRVSVNTATQQELEALPGIGPVTAGKIISNRPYLSLEELLTKKAMSQSLFDKLKDSLAL